MDFVTQLFAGSPVGLVVLISIFIIYVTIRGGISKRVLAVANKDNKDSEDKTKPLQSNPYIAVLDIISIITVMFMLLVVNARFGPQIKDFFEIDTTTPTNTTTTPKTTPQQTTPQQTAPTYQAPKQLYYSIGCYSCWTSGCPSDGYSYNGSDATTYNYYDNLCHICDCNSINGRSYWK